MLTVPATGLKGVTNRQRETERNRDRRREIHKERNGLGRRKGEEGETRGEGVRMRLSCRPDTGPQRRLSELSLQTSAPLPGCTIKGSPLPSLASVSSSGKYE